MQQRYRWKYLRGQRRLTIDNWLPIHADKVVFRYDDGGPAAHRADQIGIRVGGSYTEGQSIRGRWQVERVGKIQPTDYGLAYFLENWERPLVAIHKHLIEDGEFEVPERAGRIHGVGIRDRIYWTWYQKQEALAWLVEYLERSAFGIELWSYPAGNPEAYEKTRKAAQERIGNGRNTVLVPVWPDMEGLRQTVQRIEPGMAGVEALDRLLREYFGHAIKRDILGQTLTSEAAGTGLGSNLASIHLDTYLQIVRFDACNLEESLTTELVQPLLTFNFPQHADIPLRFKIETESPDVEGRLSSMLKAFEMGLKIPAKDVAAMLGIARPEEGDDVLQNAQARQSASMAAEGQQPGGLFRGLSLPGANGAAESDQETPSPDPCATERFKAVCAARAGPGGISPKRRAEALPENGIIARSAGASFGRAASLFERRRTTLAPGRRREDRRRPDLPIQRESPLGGEQSPTIPCRRSMSPPSRSAPVCKVGTCKRRPSTGQWTTSAASDS